MVRRAAHRNVIAPDSSTPAHKVTVQQGNAQELTLITKARTTKQKQRLTLHSCLDGNETSREISAVKGA